MQIIPESGYNQQGFNLIELLLVLVIVGILISYLVPSYQRLVEQQSQRSELARLQAVLNHARYMATMNNKVLQLCASDDGKQCDASAFHTGNVLIVVADSQQWVHFSAGTGYPIVFPRAAIKISPLPDQDFGGTLLPCTGFNYNQAKSLTISAAGRVRVNTSVSASQLAQCPN